MTAPLSQRMREAADALQEFNTENDLYTPDAPWRPSELRKEAVHREAEERGAAEKAREMEDLAITLFATQHTLCPDRPDLESWVETTSTIRENCRALATAIIEAGWRKGDSDE